MLKEIIKNEKERKKILEELCKDTGNGYAEDYCNLLKAYTKSKICDLPILYKREKELDVEESPIVVYGIQSDNEIYYQAGFLVGKRIFGNILSSSDPRSQINYTLLKVQAEYGIFREVNIITSRSFTYDDIMDGILHITDEDKFEEFVLPGFKSIIREDVEEEKLIFM